MVLPLSVLLWVFFLAFVASYGMLDLRVSRSGALFCAAAELSRRWRSSKTSGETRSVVESMLAGRCPMAPFARVAVRYLVADAVEMVRFVAVCSFAQCTRVADVFFLWAAGLCVTAIDMNDRVSPAVIESHTQSRGTGQTSLFSFPADVTLENSSRVCGIYKGAESKGCISLGGQSVLHKESPSPTPIGRNVFNHITLLFGRC